MSSDQEVIDMRMAELEDALERNLPEFPKLLSEIHTKLLADKDNVTLLTPEQIGVYSRALMRRTGEVILVSKAKKSSSKTTKLALDDI